MREEVLRAIANRQQPTATALIFIVKSKLQVYDNTISYEIFAQNKKIFTQMRLLFGRIFSQLLTFRTIVAIIWAKA